MDREEAERRAAELNRDHPDRGSHRWLAGEGEEGWRVARVSVPGGVRLEPLKQGVESRPRPSDPPDPRPVFDQNVNWRL